MRLLTNVFALVMALAMSGCEDTVTLEEAGWPAEGLSCSSPGIVPVRGDGRLIAEVKDIQVGASGDIVELRVLKEGCVAVSTEDWIRPVGREGGSLLLSVEANPSEEGREGHVIVRLGEDSETVGVYQRGQALSLLLSPRTVPVGAGGGDITIEVRDDAEVKVSMGGALWIRDTGRDGERISFEVERNDWPEERTCAVLLRDARSGDADTVSVVQYGEDTIIVEDEDVRVPWTGGAVTLHLMASGEVDVRTETGWMRHLRTRSLTESLLVLEADPNPSGEDREAILSLSCGTAEASVRFVQDGRTREPTTQREALMELFRTTGGTGWKNSEGWGSGRPLDEWYGVVLDRDGNVSRLELNANGLTGTIPAAIARLEALTCLYMADNDLEYHIPEEAGRLERLVNVWLAGNRLDGRIPEGWGRLGGLRYLNLVGNRLEGRIPDLSGARALQKIYLSDNRLEGEIPWGIGGLEALTDLWLDGNRLEGNIPESMASLERLASFRVYGNRLDGTVPAAVQAARWWQEVRPLLEQQDGHALYAGGAYVSSDYSHDGELRMLQRHVRGRGIPLAVVCDGFSDRMVDDGSYRREAERAVEDFFSAEPYTTYRDLFDVYEITAVSEEEDFGGRTALGTRWDGTMFKADRDRVRELLLAAGMDGSLMPSVTVIAVLNTGDGGRMSCSYSADGFAVALCSRGGDGRRQVLHEAGGHAFGKLADEYASDDRTGGASLTEDMRRMLEDYHGKGWYMNVSDTSDLGRVPWSRFVGMEEYAAEGIGAYEGAMSRFSSGVWRPTEESVMRGRSVMGFSAPCRWFIFRRMMELAGLEAGFGEFLEYDRVNR